MIFLRLWLPVVSMVAALTSLAAQPDEFPTPYNSETGLPTGPPTPQESLALLKLPPGFKATVFAAEPDVQNPISMTWDSRGRLWIAENYTYAERAKAFDLHLRDRILIFNDHDGDGHFDTRKVFSDELQKLTSVEVGFGGVWAMCPPQLLFIPDRNGDDQPDGPAEVKLDGFTVPEANYHNFANGLHWGPDGWLYGRCGASAPGLVGVPGTPVAERVPLHGGVWRFHPRRQVFEVISSGTMNPWGNDWDAQGEGFFINTVNGHLWHLIPGAHFMTAHTIDPNPRTYELMAMHADHWHFDTAKGWTQSRDGAANDFGGGHAHSGAMVYLGDNLPAQYRGHLFTVNYHGRRLNQEILERAGSGYVGRHGEDCLFSGDPWFRGVELGYGPDGGIFVLDWSDVGECHEATGVHRTSGRIYKIRYGNSTPPTTADLGKLGIRELVGLQLHTNEWFARQARLQLALRAGSAEEIKIARTQLHKLYAQQTAPVSKLRVMWSLHIIGADDDQFLRRQLSDSDEHVRTWAIRLLSDSWPLDNVLSRRPAQPASTRPVPPATREAFARLAKSDSSGLVRLALASTLQRLPVAQRPQLAAPLLGRSEDATDRNLPLLIWYGLIPLAETEPATLVRLAAGCQLPLTRKLMARRLGEDLEKNPAPLNDLLKVTTTKPPAFQADILAGLAEAWRGWSKARKPAAWNKLQRSLADSSEPGVRDRIRELSVLFGDGRALAEVRSVALDSQADLSFRRAALQTLIDKRSPDLREVCEQLLAVRFLNSTAVQGLSLFDDPAIGEKLAASYGKFHPSERGPVMDTLASRPAFARPMLEEMAEGRIARTDLTPFHARQIRSFHDATLDHTLAKVWGVLRESPAEKQQLIAQLKGKLTPTALAAGDLRHGRLLFEKTCANCHTLYGRGGQTGPDLTGSGRDNLDYLLDNIIDPSASVSADFHMTIVEMKDGRTLNGLVTAKTDRTITVRTMTETLTLERSGIERLQDSSLSLMPEGLLDALPEPEVRDLIAYLMSRSQTQ